MKTLNKRIHPILMAFVVLCVSCSTTKNLPEGEILYTGLKKIEVSHEDKTSAGQNTVAEVKAVLEYSPNNALFGSSYTQIPFPVGLWMYNALANKRGKFNKFLFNQLASKPVFISMANPEVRVKVAQNLLREYGYFQGNASFEVVPDPTNPKKAAVRYKVEMNNPYTYDSIQYIRLRHRADTLIQNTTNERLIHRGENFNVVQLEAERQRIAKLLRNNGFYYYRPDYVVYQADTTIAPGTVSLRITRKPGVSSAALRPWKIGQMNIWLNGYNNETPTDSLLYNDLMIHYEGQLRVRPSVLYRQFTFKSGDYYTQEMQDKTHARLSRLGIFRYSEMQYAPQDTSRRCDTLNLRINTFYDLPLDGELEFNVVSKSNQLTGPGAIFGLTKRNLFRGGETFNVSGKASYEWQTGSRAVRGSLLNSYEIGASSSLTFPHVLFPGFRNRTLEYPSSTQFRLFINQLTRSGFFRMLSFGGNMTYDFQPTATSRHSVVPLRVSYNLLQSTSELFDTIIKTNQSLKQSLKSQLVPAMSYTYTFDNTPITALRSHVWWETTISQSGNIISGVYALSGKSFNEEGKTLLNNPFSQFVKLSSEIRYNYRIDRNQSLVTRMSAGAIYSYGNARFSPYSEQFYTGGANSVRAFTIRSIGPGSFPYDKENKYGYIDQIGDLKFEANIEFRFRLYADLFGAAFIDAGNTWLIRNDDDHPGGKFEFKNFFNQLALGTGFGIRYDLDFIVLRLDAGVKVHTPYDTGKKGYFNTPKYDMKALGIHLAVGYPF